MLLLWAYRSIDECLHIHARLHAQEIMFLDRWKAGDDETAEGAWGRKAFTRMGSWVALQNMCLRDVSPNPLNMNYI